MNEDAVLKQQLSENFGEETYLTGTLNKPYLAAAVFSDPAKLALLNSLVHPATIADAGTWMHMQTSPYAIKEAALIFESNAHLQLDYVIGVAAPYALRLQRGMQRDGASKAAIEERMKNQLDEEEKMRRCDFIINNDESELLIPQVLKLHETLLLRATCD